MTSFRRRTEIDEEPNFAHVGWLNGAVWIDMSREQVYSHNAVKTELARGSAMSPKKLAAADFFSDGMLLSNIAGDLCGPPDGLFVSFASFAADRCHVVQNRHKGGIIELEGMPDLVIEVVSRSSVTKDTSGFAKDSGSRASRNIG